MKIALALLLSIPAADAMAECAKGLPLEGSLAIPTCDHGAPGCRPAYKLLYEYTEAMPDDDTSVDIAMHSSPWRMYDPQMRIVTAKEMAETIRPHLDAKTRRVRLVGSWTGIAPTGGRGSHAQQVSALIDPPVEGLNGFLWLTPEGGTRVTRQAFSVRRGGGPYSAPAGADVMASLVAGWPAELEEEFAAEGDADGVMRAGAGWDVFLLCPDRALAAFERAAAMKHPIAAYNAALMRLERGAPGDATRAAELLQQAAALGDAKSRTRLDELRAAGPRPPQP